MNECKEEWFIAIFVVNKRTNENKLTQLFFYCYCNVNFVFKEEDVVCGFLE